MPVWAWLVFVVFVVFVVFIDAAHVYASLYRTYFDPDELARRRRLYVLTPIVCFAVGVVLHSLGALVFWRILAYVAVYHFVRQQYSFVMLYRYRGGERGGFDRTLDKTAIYSTMFYPLAFWHAAADRRFEWFVEADFLLLPAWIARRRSRAPDTPGRQPSRRLLERALAGRGEALRKVSESSLVVDR